MSDYSNEKIAVALKERATHGGCNFCSRPHRVVFVVWGQGVQVRFCRKCMAHLRRAHGWAVSYYKSHKRAEARK